MIKSSFNIAFLLLLSGCCSLADTYNPDPTSCQCKKFNTLVRNSLIQPTTEFNYYTISNNTTRDSLVGIILENKECWIGKTFDFVSKQLPPPSNKYGFYGAMEDINCKGNECLNLQITFQSNKKESEIGEIVAVLGNSPHEGWGIVLYAAE